MSYSKIIFFVTVSFSNSSSFGMESEILSFGMELLKSVKTYALEPSFKGYRNSYFDSELQKTLLPLMAKNDNHQSIHLPKEIILVIAEKNYNLYLNEFIPKRYIDESWGKCFNRINDEKHITQFNGQKIKINDFDFITMNEQGKQIFKSVVTKKIHTENEYNEILQLPQRLRSKIGKSYIIYIPKESYSTHMSSIEQCITSNFQPKKQPDNINLAYTVIEQHYYPDEYKKHCEHKFLVPEKQ
jgi:hypothetical protein